MTRRARFWLRTGAVLLAAVFLAGAAALWLLQSDWLREKVRQRIVLEIENATGGRVELAAFHFDWRALRADLDRLVIHGLESPDQPPLFRAAHISAGLKIVSGLQRKIEIAFLQLRACELSVTVDKNGRTNIPEPKTPRDPKKPLQRFLDLSVGEYRVSNSSVGYRDSRWPVDASGRGLEIRLDFDRPARAYSGEFRSAGTELRQPLRLPLAADAGLAFRLTQDRLAVSKLELSANGSSVSGAGEVAFSDPPSGNFQFRGRQSVPELIARLPLPILPQGNAAWNGRLEFKGTQWNARGDATASGLAYRQYGVDIRDASLGAHWSATADELKVDNFEAQLLGGAFSGQASIRDWSTISLSGEAAGFALDKLNQARAGTNLAWSAIVSGPVSVEGAWGAAAAQGWQVTTDLTLEPSSDGVSVGGRLAMDYDTRRGEMRFAESAIQLPHTRVHFSGSLDGGITFGLFSSNLDDLLPALALASEQAPAPLPLRLEKGTARFQGKLTGTWSEPHLKGQVEAGPLRFDDRALRHFKAVVDASPSLLILSSAEFSQDSLRGAGNLELALENWRPVESSRLAANLSLEAAALDAALNENRLDYPLKGKMTVRANLEGTWGGPRGQGRIALSAPEFWGEPFESADADLRFSSHRIELLNGKLRDGASVLDLSGSLERPGEGWQNSQAQFSASTAGLTLRSFALLDVPKQLSGRITGRLAGAARIVNGQPQLASVGGRLELADLNVSGRPAGGLLLVASTSGTVANFSLDGSLIGSSVHGSAEWSLGSRTGYGLGQVRVSRLTLDALQDLGIMGVPGRPLPAKAVLDGEIGFSGPVLQPDRWTAAAKITTLEIEPSTAPANGKRVLLRNRDPLVAHIDSRGLHVQSAHIIGEGTDLEASGTVAFRARSTWNLQLKGGLELPALATLEPDLLATGKSTLDATIRGSLERPQVNGRLELKDASFYLRGVPNGLEKANGVILFDRSRASLDNFTAQTGGGDLKLSGFIGFGGDQLVYRLQANAQRVRVRYPEAVSTTFDASLNLTGTAAQSMLSGGVTVTKMGITPKTDLGSLLAETGAAGPPVPPNEFLRNMQLDVRIETSTDAELQTSLTRDIQPEADLRLRGTPERPVLLGRVSVNQGEIQFFGNRYNITQGDISFFNPVKVEPVLNLDVETRVRGITVTINFSGPVGKLNVSYRSDPPLQSAEIVALLTVGRAPGTSVAGSVSQNQSFLQSGSNSLLGQAVAAPLSGRLQRFFGVSRLKIDPDLTGVTNTPQARLTIEQQLTRDITMTYITSLNRTQQQIVRLQWDFSRDYSMIAVRDDNGIFGIDFQYRKRFK
ncbi:MAG: hypothetical protein FJW20_10850 [Acidimicrobiia bacterium]|nr:hypothetical protein [Acidimicrobiia bacterium]